MRTRSVTFFTEKEEMLVNLFVELGTKRNIAMVLVFLANMPETTSRDIERGTDLRQPEVCMAMQHLVGRQWAAVRDSTTTTKGRPLKIYSLVKPIREIVGIIEKEKTQEAEHKLQLTKKLRKYVPG